MKQVIPFAQEQDITVIIPAGNDAPTGLHENTPQILGTADNGLITVGGVEMDGSLFTLTNPDLGMGGSISIYAPARDVLCASTGSDSATRLVSGTSVAAPAVAGMAAYFFSLQELDSNWPAGLVARAMKQFFFLSANIQRHNAPVPWTLDYYTLPSNRSIRVACKYRHTFYSLTLFQVLILLFAGNRHPGNSLGGCGAASSKVKRQDDLPDLSCPVPSDSDSDTSMTTMTMSAPTSSEVSSTTTSSSETSSEISSETTTSSETSLETSSETTTISSTSSTTSPPSTTSDSFCTVVYADGSSCVQVPSNTCGFGSKIVCPLAKRGAHAATATTFFASGSFVTAHPTAVAMAA
jgi:hypothetical protein